MSSPAEVDGHRRSGGKNDEDDESDQDGAPLKVNDLRRRTGNGRPTLRRGEGGMSWSND